VKVESDSVTKTVGVQPASIWDLSVGGGVYTTNGAECINLAAGTGSEKYLVGMLNTSETSSLLTDLTQSSITGTTLSGEPVEDATIINPMSDDVVYFENPGTQMDAGPPLPPEIPLPPPDPQEEERWRAHYEGEARLRETEVRMRSELGPYHHQGMAPARIMNADQMVPKQVGDTHAIAVPNASASNPCVDATVITTVIKHLGTYAVFLEDQANPDGAIFTTAEYETQDALLGSDVLPTIKSYFGEFANITGLGIDNEIGHNDTGRIGVILTKEVNKTTMLGFVFRDDLLGRGACGSSEQAEVFYGQAPDVGGVYGTARTKAKVQADQAILLPHESVHILQYAQEVYVSGVASKTSWEHEAGATLAEQLVGNAILEHGGSGQDLGATALAEGLTGDKWYNFWYNDLVNFLGNSSGGKITNAPEQCSWLAASLGPCVGNNRAVYGIPATLLRVVLDRHGPSYPGGEAALMRAITSGSQSGLANLTSVTGDSKGLLLTLFGSNLFVDGRVWDSSSLTSWDLHAILSGGDSTYPLSAYQSSQAAPSGSISVRAGSTGYLEWSAPSSHAPTSIRITTPALGNLPDEMVLWIFRIQWDSWVHFSLP
jgi:hypothetical protein